MCFSLVSIKMRQPRNIEAEDCIKCTLSRCFLCLLSLHEHSLQCFPSGSIKVYARDFYLPRVSSVPVFKQGKYTVGVFGRLLMLLIVSSACSLMNAFSANVFSSGFARKNLSILSHPTATCCHPTTFHLFAGAFCVVMWSSGCA